MPRRRRSSRQSKRRGWLAVGDTSTLPARRILSSVRIIMSRVSGGREVKRYGERVRQFGLIRFGAPGRVHPYWSPLWSFASFQATENSFSVTLNFARASSRYLDLVFGPLGPFFMRLSSQLRHLSSRFAL